MNVSPRAKKTPTGDTLGRLTKAGERRAAAIRERDAADQELREAIDAAMIAGASFDEVARLGQIAKSTVQKWRS